MTGRWYHRNITGVEAERLLHEYGQDGSFLIRPSQSTSNSYTLSVRCGNAFKHIKIHNNGDFYDIGEGGDKFATLAELVEHFILKETLRDKNDGTILVLKYPLSYKEPTTERYYHGSISGTDANNLLLEKAKPGSYLVRESRSNPQNYVLCVRCENNKIVHLVITFTKDGYTMQNCSQCYPTLDEFIKELAKMCPIVDSKDNVVYLKQPLNASRVNAINLSNRVRDLEKDNKERAKVKNGFAEEFEALQQQDSKLLYDRKEGEKPENRSKNRFKTILPFDHTRFVLTNSSDSDYINANYIKSDETFGKTYIATQGPLSNTISDFWSMIWQESSQFILMITHETEKGRVKCCRYWPDINQQVKYDNLIIKCVEIREYDDYLLRELIISNLRNLNQERKIFHFQYLAWSDHSVPENVTNTLNFIDHYNRLYKQNNCSTAVTVHCSAGIGRTGAIIVIDMIIDKIKHYGLQCDIDVQKTVLLLRSQRSGMVQTEKQYQFLYIALNEYIESEKKKQAMKNKQQKPIILANNNTNSTTSINVNSSNSITNGSNTNIKSSSTEAMNRSNNNNTLSRSNRNSNRSHRDIDNNFTESKLTIESEHSNNNIQTNSSIFHDNSYFNNNLTASSYLQDDSGYLLPDEYSNNNNSNNHRSRNNNTQQQQQQLLYQKENNNKPTIYNHSNNNSNSSNSSKLRTGFQNSINSFNSGSSSNLRKLSNQNSEYINLYDGSQSSMEKMNNSSYNYNNSDFDLSTNNSNGGNHIKSNSKSNINNSSNINKLLPTPPVITNRTLMNTNKISNSNNSHSSNSNTLQKTASHQRSSNNIDTASASVGVSSNKTNNFFSASSASSSSKPPSRGYSVDRSYNEKTKKK